VWPLDGSCCYILRACDRVYLWKGGRATLDARTYGQDFSSKLADESGVDVTVLAEHVEDILFAAHFKEVNWVVYAEPPTSRVARGVERRLETNVKKMHSVTVRSWLHTGDAVRKHNPVLSELQQGELIGIRAWSIDSFNLIPVTQDEVGQFASDKSYLVQCTYRAEGLDRHMIYFWQGWACSKVESLVWQYDVQALMTTRLEKLTGCKPIQVGNSSTWTRGAMPCILRARHLFLTSIFSLLSISLSSLSLSSPLSLSFSLPPSLSPSPSLPLSLSLSLSLPDSLLASGSAQTRLYRQQPQERPRNSQPGADIMYFAGAGDH
jgi:hypothetical protein